MKKSRIILAFLLFIGFQAMAQMQITGTVTGVEDGLSIPGVSVVVKDNPTIGTTTDLDGKYTITVPSSAEILLFSFVGMKAQEVSINGRSLIDVQMESDVLEMDEVVVVGYGTQLKSELTGAITKLTTEAIKDIPAPSFESAIQGKTAGVFIESGSGKLGQSIKMRIRGSSSISASNQPLYVIDGFPVISESQGSIGNEDTNPLADLNSSDIASIQILKDASAAAIYGARASNGVVIITTKRGKEGKTNFNFSYQTATSQPTNKVDFMNGDEYLQIMNEAFINSSSDGTVNGTIWGMNRDELFDWAIPGWDQGYDTDWQSEAFQTGKLNQYDLSASGGNDKTKFFSSVSYSEQEGILLNNEFDKMGVRLNLDQQATDKLSFGLNLSLARTENRRVANDNAFSTPLQLIALPPVQPKIDPATNELNANTVYFNGLIADRDNSFNSEVYRNNGNLYGAYQIIPGLSYRTEAGIDMLYQREEVYWGRETDDGGPEGYARDRQVTIRNVSTNNYLTFDKILANVHDVNVIAGMSYQSVQTDQNQVEGRGFPNDNFKRINSAAEIVGGAGSATKYTYNSYFARLNYKFNERYLLALSGRIDGSSRFGADNRYGFFPAVSGGWIMSNEGFLEGLQFLSFFKIRASWGLTGNSEIGNFDSRGLYQGSSYSGLSGMTASSIPSPDLRWEKTAQTDIGIDFGFFNNRLTGEIDYYIKNTTDLLLNVTVPGTTGFTSITQNVGKLENKGYEFSFHSNNFVGEFEWTTTFNISFNENKVTDLDGQIITAGSNRAAEGYPIGIFWTKKYAGVNSTNGDGLFYINDQSDATTNDITLAEEQFVGDPNPDYTGGITNTFSYKGIDLSVLVQFVQGNDVMNAGRQWQAQNGDWFDNQTKDQLDYWTTENTDASVPQPRFAQGNGYGVSSRLIFDGSYVRLKDITLGYNLPMNIVKKAKLSGVRLYVKALNLFTWTDYPGWDPEVNYGGTGATTQFSNIRQGYDFYTTPQAKTFAFGVNINF